MEDLSVQLMDMSVFLEVRTILFESTVVHINRDKLGKRKEKILIKKLDYTFSIFTKSMLH